MSPTGNSDVNSLGNLVGEIPKRQRRVQTDRTARHAGRHDRQPGEHPHPSAGQLHDSAPDRDEFAGLTQPIQRAAAYAGSHRLRDPERLLAELVAQDLEDGCGP